MVYFKCCQPLCETIASTVAVSCGCQSACADPAWWVDTQRQN